MSFWSTQTFRDRIKEIIIDEKNPEDNISNCCYDLTVGDEIFISPLQDSELKDRKIINFTDKDVSYIIPPGQFAYLITKETVHIPTSCIGFISFKFGIKARGLINVSGFHVNPGYKGKLIFALFNASGFNHEIKRGEEAFSLWISTLDSDSNETSVNGYKSLNDLNPDILNINDPVTSLPVLAKQIEIIKSESDKNSLKVAIVIALLIPIDIAFINILITSEGVGENYFSFLIDDARWYVFIVVILIAVYPFAKFIADKGTDSIIFFKKIRSQKKWKKEQILKEQKNQEERDNKKIKL